MNNRKLHQAAIEAKGGACIECPHKSEPAFEVTLPFGVKEPRHIKVRVNCTLSGGAQTKPKSLVADWQQCQIYTRWQRKLERDKQRENA